MFLIVCLYTTQVNSHMLQSSHGHSIYKNFKDIETSFRECFQNYYWFVSKDICITLDFFFLGINKWPSEICCWVILRVQQQQQKMLFKLWLCLSDCFSNGILAKKRRKWKLYFFFFLFFLGLEDKFISFGHKARTMNTFIECAMQWVE